MRRALSALVVPALLVLTATPALAQQTGEKEPDEGGQVEPVQASYSVYVSNYEIIVGGEPQKAFVAGSESRFRLTLHNGGEERARDISLVLRSQNPSLDIVDARASIGDLAPGASDTATFTVRASEQDCVADGSLLLKMSSSLGDRDEYVSGHVLCPGPNVYPGEIRYEGGDGDGTPEPGERLKVFVSLWNYGRDAATDVIARIRIDHPKVTVIEPDSSWPNIAPDGSADARTPFIIEIAEDAETQDNGCGSGGPGPATREEPVTSDPVTSDPGAEDAAAEDAAAEDAARAEEGGSTPADGGGSEPSGGSADGSTGQEPADEPQRIPDEGEPPPDYQEPDPSVAFEATIVITASGTEFESGFGTQMYCMLESEGRPADGAARGGDLGAPTDDRAAELGLPAASTGGSSRTSAATIGALLIVLVAGGMLLRGRFSTR